MINLLHSHWKRDTSNASVNKPSLLANLLRTTTNETPKHDNSLKIKDSNIHHRNKSKDSNE